MIVVVVVRSLLRTSERALKAIKRLLYKTKLCYRDQNQAFKKLPAILFVQLVRRSGGGGGTSLRFKVKICAFLLVFHVSFFFFFALAAGNWVGRWMG